MSIQTKLAHLLCYFVVVVFFSGCNFLPEPKIPSPQVSTNQNTGNNPTSFNQSTAEMKISRIQGAQHRSPMDGKKVENVLGIVTAITGQGFYLQDPNPDTDDRTSEAVFVLSKVFTSVSVGDEVRLKNGIVHEFNPAGIGENSLTITEIELFELEIISKNNPLPEAVLIGDGGRQIPNTVIVNDVIGYVGRVGNFDPEEDGIDFYESLESMRVQVNNAVAISSTSSYKELVVLADLGKNATGFSDRGVLILDKNDPNPERIILDDAFINIPDIPLGTRFSKPIIGIISYSYGNFKLQPTQKIQFVSDMLIWDSMDFLATDSELTVATYNVENLNAMERPERVKQLAKDIVQILKSPDIIALQEIQDNDGVIVSNVVEADSTINRIIGAIKNSGGPTYQYLTINPQNNSDGGVEGGNIRVAVLYRTDRGLILGPGLPGNSTANVNVRENKNHLELNFNPGRISPESYAFYDSRKPLVASFIFRDEDIFIIVNHFNSKGEDGPLYGDMQPPNLSSERQRIEQARLVNKFVKEIISLDPEAKIIVLGDLNDFPWSAPLNTLRGNELYDPMTRIAVDDRFTYIYEGNGQVLDYILFSNSLAYINVYFDILHINSVASIQQRLSDHDPVLAIFDFN